MSYEIPLPMPEQLSKKPITNALELHRHLEKNGFKPIAVVVNNANAKVIVYFERELDEDQRKELFETVIEFYRSHIGITKDDKKVK